MEAKNLRGRESENCRIGNIEFNVDLFTGLGYTDNRNRGRYRQTVSPPIG